MTIEFPCNNCLQPLRVPDTSAGKGARCPKCKAISVVPGVGGRESGVGGQVSGGPSAAPPRPAYPPVQSPAPPPPTAPSPQQSANDALFAMLKAATTPQPLAPPPGAAAGVPTGMPPSFSEPAASSFSPAPMGPAASVNPYASPAEAYLSHATAIVPGQRPGLPWEVEGPGIVSWWKTTQMCLTDASHAFRLMRQEGGIGSPLLFAALGLLLGFVGQTLWRLPVLLMEAAGGNKDWMENALIEIGAGAAISLGMATFGLFIAAGIYHVCLLAVGGANHGYETTYRVVAFTHGSIAWLQVIPCVGGCIVLVMLYVCLINGLAAAQETTGGKAAAAVFIPLGFFLLLGALAIGGIVALAIALDA